MVSVKSMTTRLRQYADVSERRLPKTPSIRERVRCLAHAESMWRGQPSFR